MCVCVCVCEREREREREGITVSHIFYFLLFLQEFSLKSCKFSLSCYVSFSPALLDLDYFSSSQDYLDDKVVVTLTDFARAVYVLEYQLLPYTKLFIATTLYGMKRRFKPVRWTKSQNENLLFAISCRLAQHYTMCRDTWHINEKSAEV